MYTIDFNKPLHVHFTGIGGISMSGLAEVLIKENFQISGSDNSESALTRHLESMGAIVYYGHKADHITPGTDLVVYTAAVKDDNPELLYAREHGIPLLSRAELLGQLMRNYRLPVAVSGTHGKTTTTSMLSQILIDAEKGPTISIGGILKSIGGNIRVGDSDIFVTEACEYTNSFLHFFPKIGIILNIDADHLDFFKDLADIRHSFRLFAELLPEDGTLIINNEIDDLAGFTRDLACQVVTYGLTPEADYHAGNITFDETGNASFDLINKEKKLLRVSLSVGGEHNVSNALAALAAARLLDVPLEAAAHGISAFTGTDRRFEYKGTFNGVTVVDDYAHHPTEIRATLHAASRYPHNKIFCIFQPHTYSRTKALFPEFVSALSHGADTLIITDIYAARETNTIGMDIQDLVQALKDTGCNVLYFSDFSEIEHYCTENCTKGDLLITMGAGNVVDIGNHLVSK